MLSNWDGVFYYDPTSPSHLAWAMDIYTGKSHKMLKVSMGTPAGCSRGNGYYVVRYQRKLMPVHRVIWEIFNGPIPNGKVVDHIDGNPSNNRICNLRLTTQATNSRNSAKKSSNKTGVTGVYYVNNRGYEYMVAQAQLGSKVVTKAFSVAKLGREAATEMASAHRAKLVEDFNKSGAGYSERHGT